MSAIAAVAAFLILELACIPWIRRQVGECPHDVTI